MTARDTPDRRHQAVSGQPRRSGSAAPTTRAVHGHTDAQDLAEVLDDRSEFDIAEVNERLAEFTAR